MKLYRNASVMVLIIVLIPAYFIKRYNYNECRKMGGSKFYCLISK